MKNNVYDTRSQLANETSTRGAGYTHSFAYNGAANPTSWKGAARTFNSNNQETTGSAFLYDGAGNTTQMPNGNLATPAAPAPTHKLIYNAQGQLAQLRDANNVVIASYVYRGDGKRAWKELANGTRSYFYYAGEQLIAATNGANVSSLQLWGADGLIGARTLNSTTSAVTKTYNLYDTQGNLAQTVNGLTGYVNGHAATNAWGEPLRDSAGNVAGAGYGAKFGYIRDAESGFYLCTLRYYDPSAGRWITRDPIGYAGGSNLYGYVENDPVNATDPSGLITSGTPRNEIEGNNQALRSNIAGTWESMGIGANAGIDGILRVFGAPYYAIKPDAPGLMESMGGYDSKDPVAKWSRNSGEVAGYAISIWMATPQSAGSGGAVSQWGPGTSKWVLRDPASWRNWIMSGCPGRYALKSGRTWIPKPGTVSRVPGWLEGWKTIFGQSIIK